MAYSQDLRERVLGFVEKGGSKEEAAERYGVGVSTVYLWCKTPKKVRAEKPGPTGRAIPEDKWVYVDETGFNEPLIREYAYGKRGDRLLGERTGKRFARTSLIAGLKLNKSLAPMDVKGYCDTRRGADMGQALAYPRTRAG